jgi:hypothetical protein
LIFVRLKDKRKDKRGGKTNGKGEGEAEINKHNAVILGISS